jgi:hypothetical protein
MQKEPFLAARQTKAVKPWPDHTPKWQIAECSLSVLLCSDWSLYLNLFAAQG